MRPAQGAIRFLAVEPNGTEGKTGAGDAASER